MSITYKIWNFPTFPISKQLFHVPAEAVDGGFTTGGARIYSPEPGGRSVLELQPSMQANEWSYPLSSWIMSKINGEIFKVRLAPTPQVATSPIIRGSGVPWAPNLQWSNLQNWEGDIYATFLQSALEGSTTLVIDMSQIGQLLQHGHVIGHDINTYMIDDIQYNEVNIATISVKPPLRKDVAAGDQALFRPYFVGTISNGSQVRATYDAEQNGFIQPGLIIFDEVLL